jgi:hypothetical protein
MKISDHSPISLIKQVLDRMFGAIPWCNYEVETLLLETGLPATELCREKLNLLRVLGHHPELFYQDHLFFLHAVETMNNKVTDFDFIPTPSSLEMAFAIHDMARTHLHSLDESPAFSQAVILTVKHCLINEGYSAPIGPFSHIGITGLHPGQTQEDTNNKLKAIIEYVNSNFT